MGNTGSQGSGNTAAAQFQEDDEWKVRLRSFILALF